MSNVRPEGDRAWRVTPPLWVAGLVGAVVVLGLLTLTLATYIPGAVVPDAPTAAEQARLAAESAVRNTVIQALAGLVIVVGLCLTARSLHISRETHLTDRLARAVDQLGSGDGAVRLGGVHSLERLARNSRGDRSMVANVLTGYLQVRAGATSPPPASGTIEPDVQTALTILVRLDI